MGVSARYWNEYLCAEICRIQREKDDDSIFRFHWTVAYSIARVNGIFWVSLGNLGYTILFYFYFSNKLCPVPE